MTTWVLQRRPERRGNNQLAGQARRKTSLRLTRAAAWFALTAFSAGALAAPSALLATHKLGSSMIAAGGSASTAPAAAADQNKDQLIRTLVNLTDVNELQSVFSQQFIDRVSSAVSMFGPAITPQTMNVIQQQTRQVVQEHIDDGDALYSVLEPVYEKHFNIIELSQLVSFYQSPLGQKLVAVSPQLLTESLDLGQQWGMSLVPEIMQRVQAQLNGQTPASTGGNAAPQ